jgi:NitT/TauT family transport system substrate-binding protein
MDRRTALSTLGALGASAMFSRAQAAPAGLKPLRIALGVNGLVWYPSFVARAAGYFHDEGLDDQWIDVGGSGTSAVAAVMGGDVPMTMQGLDHAMLASVQGADLVAFCALENAYPLPLVLTNKALAKTGIKVDMSADEKVKRLAGLTIAVTSAGSGTDEFLRNMLLVRKMDPDSVLHIQPLGSADTMLAAFSKNMIDGMVTTAPYPEIVETKGLGLTIIDAMRGDLPEMRGVPYSAALTTRKTIAEHPDMIYGSTKAMARAMLLAKQHPDQARDSLRQYFPTVDRQVFDKMEASYRAASATSPVVSRESFERLATWKRIAKGTANFNPSYQKAVVTDFAVRAAKEVGIPA